MRPIAYAYHADLYCADCGADLPDIDPEGNEKSAVFSYESFDHIPYCAGCGLPIEGLPLTTDGVRHVVDFLAHCATSLDVDWDALEDALRYIQPYEQYLTAGERALIAALAADDARAAYTIAKYYREVNGDDLIYLPEPLRTYWPYF